MNFSSTAVFTLFFCNLFSSYNCAAQLPAFNLINLISFPDPHDSGHQITRIDGWLENSQTCLPIEFATVIIKDPSRALFEIAETDSSGMFSFFLSPQEYDNRLAYLHAEYIGVETLKLVDIRVEARTSMQAPIVEKEYFLRTGGCVVSIWNYAGDPVFDYGRTPNKDISEYARLITNSP